MGRQAWFWTEEWQQGGRETMGQLEVGEGVVHLTSAKFLAALDEDRAPLLGCHRKTGIIPVYW